MSDVARKITIILEGYYLLMVIRSQKTDGIQLSFELTLHVYFSIL
jgi:hypothetical protein